MVIGLSTFSWGWEGGKGHCSSSAPCPRPWPPSRGPLCRRCPCVWGSQPMECLPAFSWLINNLWPDTCKLVFFDCSLDSLPQAFHFFIPQRRNFKGSDLPKNIVQAVSHQRDAGVSYCSGLDKTPPIIIYDSMYFRTLRSTVHQARNLNCVDNKRKTPFHSQMQLYDASSKF